MKALFKQGNRLLEINLIGPRSQLKEVLKWLSERGLKFQRWIEP